VSLRMRIQSAATERESGDMEPTMRWIGMILMNYGRHIRVCVTVLGSLRETALIVEAGLTGGYVPARG
jgi:hypothetical protein